MIGRLCGTIVEEGVDGGTIVDVRGVGYEVTVPLGTVGRSPPDEAGAVTGKLVGLP